MIAVDIGATWLRVGLHDWDSPLVIPTPRTRDELIFEIARLVEQYPEETALGVACPGIVEQDGYVRLSFLQQINDLAFRAKLEIATSIGAVVLNDVDAQGRGAARDGEGLVVLGCGTRIGGSFVDSFGRSSRRGSYQGEFGHLPCGVSSTESCECGADDCLDLAIAGFQLEKRYGAWWESEPSRATVVDVAAVCLARAIRSLQVSLGPDRILITGRLAALTELPGRIAELTSLTIWTDTVVEFEDATWPLVCAGLMKAITGPRHQ